MDDARKLIAAKLAAAKAAGTYVSEAEHQARWEKRVADVLDPIAEALERGIRESKERKDVKP